MISGRMNSQLSSTDKMSDAHNDSLHHYADLRAEASLGSKRGTSNRIGVQGHGGGRGGSRVSSSLSQ